MYYDAAHATRWAAVDLPEGYFLCHCVVLLATVKCLRNPLKPTTPPAWPSLAPLSGAVVQCKEHVHTPMERRRLRSVGQPCAAAHCHSQQWVRGWAEAAASDPTERDARPHRARPLPAVAPWAARPGAVGLMAGSWCMAGHCGQAYRPCRKEKAAKAFRPNASTALALADVAMDHDSP